MKPARRGAGGLRTHLAGLDAALTALEELATDAPDTTGVIDQLRGQVEVLMDEIHISLGIEPPGLIDQPDEFTDLQRSRGGSRGGRRVGGPLMLRTQISTVVSPVSSVQRRAPPLFGR